MSMVTGLNPDQVVVGIARGDGLYIAEIGVALPSTASAAWGTGWTPLGYASEDGVSISNGTDTSEITSWQSISALRSIITARTITLQFQLMQWNAKTLSLYWNVTEPTVTAGAYTLDVNAGTQAHKRYQLGVDVQDGENRVRYVFPRCELTDAGDQSFTRGDAALLDMTFSALAGPDGKILTILGTMVQGASAEVSAPVDNVQAQAAPTAPAQAPAAPGTAA